MFLLTRRRDDGIVVVRSASVGAMPVKRYPMVLTERLGADVYESLTDMVDDRHNDRLTSMEARLEVRFAGIDVRFAQIDARLGSIDARFAAIDTKFAAVDDKLAALGERVERRLIQEIGGLRAETLQQRGDLLKWAMVFWVSQAAAVAGIVAVLR
jgi:hypothetical protein